MINRETFHVTSYPIRSWHFSDCKYILAVYFDNNNLNASIMQNESSKHSNHVPVVPDCQIQPKALGTCSSRNSM